MNVILGILFFVLGSLAVYIFQKKKYSKTTEEDLVCEVIQKAFIREKHSDHNEHKLVRELLKSDAFIKELSLTAKFKGMVVGYILFTKVKVGNQTLLALAPLAVLPKFQKKGIGKSLVEKGHKIAKELGYKGVVVLGHPEYYKKFGYEPASKWEIKCPIEVPDEAFMAIELYPGALKEISGIVEYPKEFGIN
ncbi:GNAT family N-acetyltransferase [Candidatus Cetobacterium colombiensis]|jgi:predicted N-acetyltransferase YhbS|uniref:N-acetyltransferase n=1 Tax=Candidatus Cetobacterium colombiensis TaxID=3073100 RepID=A0ABU4W6A2_9FUSO|nr:N-acetyltransferase [Candidatus Cetobacterium colombiensis]MDX8335053.1 N-acetyltransferase [Candidatus Cetobacterium colombiensis]